ncbi:transcription factor 20 isoform X1 [Acanthochromis polyacanthus]|uniref:transcription factor 20 isoform X1 n=1 Tax=Acanthochromis polyacanthus TaxID=80966 RepID=UPI00223409C7|nr:transcription factor 20 isoform X1 [Acanthochromis polyacanthus]XP_051797211.1 transcription factor 20 isoform X1 [Acanthochromis polyacanthus]
MQNFSNSPAPPSLPPAFSGRGGGGPTYPPQPAEPQISPRMTDDYAGMQQQSLHRGHHHPSQASHMLAYSARSRAAVEPPPTQGNIHSGSSNNPYRKDAMDYYFSMGGKDRHRRGGLGYGGGFGYPNIDGHIPHQYRHPGSSSAPTSGLMSPYPVDYGSSAGSGGGAGAFSPSHQYNMSQNPALQSVAGSQMQHRQHGQTFPAVHLGQQHRTYPHSGHRMTPQYPHYSPQGGASTGSSGMYSPPPQRYLDGAAGTGFDPKVNSSPTVNSSSNSISSSVAANNVGPMENVQQSYHASNYPGYSPQTLSLHKQATLQHRNSQHNLGVGYDNSLKMQHQGPSPGSVYAKLHQASNPSIPQPASQEIAKSPMHPNAQQTQINQNFSPISNPSPAASAVHSPSCSSSPSPLMGVSEAHGNPSGHGPSHPPTSNPRSSHGHGRLLQTMPQLSPTPNSNSSISSCGSSGSHKAHSMSAVGGSNLPPTGRNKMNLGTGIGSREEGSSVYSSSSHDKMQDAGLNSLNALSSQVANLPNTIQHMLLTDTVLSQKKKDGGSMQQATHGVPPSQPRSRNASAASSTSTVKDGGAAGVGDGASLDAGAEEDSSLMSSGTKVEREEQFSEGERRRVRQMSGASSGSEPTGYHPSSQNQTQPQTGQASNDKTVPSESPSKQQVVSETKANETHIPSLSSPSFGCQPSETGPASHSTPPVSSSPSSTYSSIPPPQPNCVPEPGLTYNDHRAGHRKTEIKNEVIKDESEGAVEKTEKICSQMQREGEVDTQNGQDKENRLHSASRLHNNEKEEKHTSEEQQNAGSIGVIVSARSEGSHTEKSKHPQDNCVEEKQSHSYLRESSSHNGEEGIDLSLYSSHHQKSTFGRPQNPPQSGPHKYGFPESAYGSDLSMKNKGKVGPAGVMESNPRYLGYQQSQTGYGPTHPKDAGSVAEALMKRGQGAGAKGHEENSQLQQFPSLLQEVLQGYNLDRRYGRPEQAFPAHLQVQQQFQTRHPYSVSEAMRMQSGPEGSTLSGQMGSSGKHPNQRHGSEPDFTTDPQSVVKSEGSNAKILQNAEKTEVGVSQSHLQPVAETQQHPPKHINLADYSLPQRKALSTPSSAVQELLLQEPEPLTGSTGQTESQKSSGSILAPSERRSVICDVSPNRRSTPERDREGDREREREKSQSGASVIQQPFSSPAAANDLSKKDAGEKQAMKMETASKEAGADAANVQTEHHGSGGANEADVEYHSKSVHSSVVMNADPYRRGNVDITPLPSHPINTNPLSSPSRHQSYLLGVDLSTAGGGTFPAYRFGDAREGNMMSRSNPHFPSHHPYHNLSPQPQTSNKLQMYPHPRGPPHHPHDLSDWVKAMNRPSKEMMMQPGSSPGRHKVSQSEQRQRMISQTDISSEQHSSKTSLHHQSPYFDMKMWESAHPGREGARMIEGDAYYRTQPPPPPPPPPLPPPAPVVTHGPVPPQISHGQNAAEPEAPRGATEEAKPPIPPPPSSSIKPPADLNSTQAQVPRQTKTGASGDTNPLILRRRVRSFISPIPAKRQLQDSSQQRAPTNSHHHSPGAHSESSHHNEDDSSSSDIPCPRLSSPLPGENTYSLPLSPSSGNTKVLPTRKGRGLKLEAIVQKITPNIKKPAGHADDESNHYPGFSHSDIPTFNDSQDQDLAHFPRVSGGDDSYMDESHSLNDMIPFRGVDDAGPLPPSAYPCDPHQTSQVLKQQDFDFGLGAAVASASGDKEDFALLGPLPPPPPLPRPVQGSPPPSSSALSDIQHFTNTYQQLETRRGEQSAANLLRQKLQESGMGFDDYPGSDYYGTTPPHHSQAQGHMLNRQHQMSSGRSSLSPQDSKSLESVVPKGYFPSGKKKGRPVGSVNKQKRAQNQVQTPAQAQAQAPSQVPTQNTTVSAPPAAPIPAPAAATTPPTIQTSSTTSAPAAPPLPESKNTPPLAPPILTQVVKADVESEDTQPEIEIKPVRRRRRGVKDEDEPLEARGRQRRRRRGAAAAAAAAAATPSMAKDDPDTPLGAGGSLGANRVSADPNRKGLFVPHIHVEKKIPEIGAVCTIVNAEEDKMKGERSAVAGKAGGSGIDSLLTSALSSQLSKRDREAEKRETDEVETTLQSGKALPSSGFVVSGPVITETNHSGRLLCCLCQKWANYKHLGDLYGPYYPAEYAAKLPKNQPQVRQCQATTGTNKTGPNSDTGSNAPSAIQDPQTQDAEFTKPSTESDYAISLDSNPTCLTPTVRAASPAGREEIKMPVAAKLSGTDSPSSSSTTVKPSLTWDMNLDIRPIPELKREPGLEADRQPAPKQQPMDEAQQRPQHRKLTSHPRFKRRHKSSEDSPRMVPSNSKASLPFQPPPPALDSLGPLAQLAQLPQMPMDPEELWVHEGCIVWTSGVYLVNGRLYGLQEALDGAREISCSYCEMVGSTLGCYSKGCTLRYHYMCAIEADCSLNEDNFSLRCPKHKVKKDSLPRASGQPSQCTWSSQREAERNEEEEETQESGNCEFGR